MVVDLMGRRAPVAGGSQHPATSPEVETEAARDVSAPARSVEPIRPASEAAVDVAAPPDPPVRDEPPAEAPTVAFPPPLRDPQWEATLAQARWIARLGMRKRRPDGTREDWLEPAQRAVLERRGRLRLALYKAADAFAAREGRAPDKHEQRRLLARLLIEDAGAPPSGSTAAAAFAQGDPGSARSHLRRVSAGSARASEETLRSDPQIATAEAPRAPPLPTSDDGEDRDPLDVAEANLRETARGWRLRGWTGAADFLEKFLNRDESPVVLSREEARKIEFVRIAEKENNRRFINDTFTGNTEKREITECLRFMTDGEKCEIQDHYNYLRPSWISNIRGFYNFAQDELPDTDRTREIDHFLSYGAFHVRSEVAFEAERHGAEIRIVGNITHRMIDTYDFSTYSFGPFDFSFDPISEAYALQTAGRGTPFEIGSVWRQKIQGTVEVLGSKSVRRDGRRFREFRLGDPRFRVWDIDP
ncbi:hypothetical protein [Algihabitans albus]|uniref:hypothetical protein n=1 Tax=Algihabitans albus TaxID=2164067 RepID=UPI000E5CB378|nr:hypothetical protein [Algihabitans albus]